MRKPCTNLAPKLTLSPNRLKQDSIWHTWSRSSIGCVQIDFREYGMFHANRTPILHQDRHCLQTDRTKLSLEPLHLGVPSRTFTTVSEPMVHWAQTMHLSCTETNTISNWTEARFHIYTSPSSSIGCIYSSIGCVQIDLWAYGMFHANRAPILHQD
jgi:hypothetical protein